MGCDRIGGDAAIGGNGGTVEVDETFIGREPGMPVKRAYHHKMKVLSLPDRERGKTQSVVVDDQARHGPADPAREYRQGTLVMTDEGGTYSDVYKDSRRPRIAA